MSPGLSPGGGLGSAGCAYVPSSRGATPSDVPGLGLGDAWRRHRASKDSLQLSDADGGDAGVLGGAVPKLDFSTLHGSASSSRQASPAGTDGTKRGPSRRQSRLFEAARPGADRHLLGPEARRAHRRTLLQSPPYERTDIDLQAMDEQVLFNSEACHHLTRGIRIDLARHVTFEAFSPGDTIVKQGELVERVFFMVSGTVQAQSSDGHGARELTEGHSIGRLVEEGKIDMATPRTRQPLQRTNPPAPVHMFDAVAKTTVECAVITQNQWVDLRKAEEHWDARQVALFLEEIPLLARLSCTQLHMLARLVRPVRIPSNTVIFQQRTEGDDIFLVREGQVRIVKEVPVDPGMAAPLNRLCRKVGNVVEGIATLSSPRLKGHDAKALLLGCPTPRASTPQARSNSTAAFQKTQPNMLPDIQRASDDTDVLATSKRVFTFAPTRNWEEKEMDVLCEPAFSTARPHYVNDGKKMLMELDTIESGHIFGQGRSGRIKIRMATAIANTSVVALQLTRADVKAHVGEDMLALWDGEHNVRSGVSEALLRARLQELMSWELYKKRVVRDVYTGKQNRCSGRWR